MTVAELAARVGDVPLWRIHTDPAPGIGTVDDVERIRRERGVLCELIDSVLVEKAVSYETAFLALEIGRLLGNFVHPRGLGWVVGADGFVWVGDRHLRAPDVHFTRRGCEKMGLAPSRNGENPGESAVAKVPVPIFSQPRTDNDGRNVPASACGLDSSIVPKRISKHSARFRSN